ncbi:MAG: hypothetical protein R3E95_21105 [Thiolinea sp.]
MAAGAFGSISFDISIDSGLPSGLLRNTGEYQYNDGSSSIPLAPTNQVLFRVTQGAGVVVNGSSLDNGIATNEPITISSATQGSSVQFMDYVWNTGNGSDSFDLQLSGSNFPAGTAFMLYQGDGYTPLLDSNGNGTPDTGALAAGAHTLVVIKAVLPSGATGSNYQVTLNASSFLDNSQTESAPNVLTTITSSSVDLTNNAALGAGTELGAGPGPEGTALTTNVTAPGTTTRFTLYLNNNSANTDNYDLAASTDSSFATQVLPAGWTVTFMDDSNHIIRNSGIIAPGASKLVYADVRIPADETAGLTSLYFRILSPVTGAIDIKHDAVEVSTVNDVILEPDNQGQVLPGGVIIYSHWLINQGNTDVSNLTLSHTDNADGWTSEIYEDTDGDGVLSGGDQRISSVASLSVDESKLLLVKVYAPATAPMGTYNLTVITAEWNAGANSISAEDLTTTNRSDVSIRKEQALDPNCLGGTAQTFSLQSFDVEPGQCVVYRLTALNTGAEQMHNVRIQDATPAFTHFITSGGLPALSQGTLATPIVQGADGEIIGNMGNLDPGANATLIFGIRIE